MEDNTFAKEVNMHLSDNALSFLKEAAKWTKFLSILGFIGIGFMFLGGFYMGFFMNTFGGMYSSYSVYSDGFWWGMAFVYWILAAVYIAPVYYLFQFSDKMTSAINTFNSERLTESFKYLKSHYKFIGIMAIVILAIYALCIIVGIIIAVVFAANFVH